MVLRENPDADLPGHHPCGARKTELGTRCVTDVISSLDPADTHHARSNNCQVKSLLLHMKTAVETIFIGKDRQYNRRFLQMCAHHLVDPVACTPASGWEKGQVENQVGLVRERFFTPRLRFKTYDELNAWLI